MDFVIMDLEWNGTYSKHHHHFFSEIIEFGAVKCDADLNIIDEFSMLVTPQIGKKLNSHVKELTHISSQELLDSHNTFTHVLSKFKKFLGNSILVTWGTSDILVLMENCKYYLNRDDIDFVKFYCNLQAYSEKILDKVDKAHQMGLKTCADLLSIEYDDKELHRALSDSKLTAMCFKKVFNPVKLPKYIESVDDEFYRKITFKNYQIYDFNSPLIDKRQMYFLCEKCGRKARRKTKWKVKNRSFRAEFRCLKCKNEFEGRISFKQTYDGIKIDKRISDIKDKINKNNDRQEE